MRLRTTPEAQPTASPSLVVCSGLALLAVAVLLSLRTVAPAATSELLPRWDLAAHLLNGWTTYDNLVHGRVGGFLWDIWSQSYWPPGQSLFQVPFYIAANGRMSGGLLSSTAAFALTAAGSVIVLGAIAGRRAWLPAALAMALMCSSPFFLAYATVAMSEMVGAMAQMAVLVCYARYDRAHDARTTRALAAALALLFFVKYNYFLLVAVPLACHGLLEHLATAEAAERWRPLRRVADWASTVPGALTVVYVLAVTGLLLAGGVAFDVAGQRVAFRTVGYSLHPLLYGWIAYAWHTHRQGRWSLSRQSALDPRVRPLVLWLLLPIVAWLASPVPNHIKDLVYLVFNIPMGPASAQLGLAAYLTAVRSEYFVHPAVFALALGAFLLAAARYRRQVPLVRLLIVTVVLQFALVAAHHTRDARFLVLAMPPFWMVSAYEIGNRLGERWPTVARAVAFAVMAASVGVAFSVAAAPTFARRAREHYVSSDALAGALAAIRDALPATGAVAVVGRRDNVSPSLMKWHLGPPSGAPAFPREITREAELPLLDEAAVVVVIDPSEASTARSTSRLQRLVVAGTLAHRATYHVPDLGLSIEVLEHRPVDRPCESHCP